MPICTMKEILHDAQEKGYGVGFYNAINLEMIRAYVRAAEDERSPIIIGTAEELLKFSGYDWIAPALISAARHAKVPVAIHLDHAYDYGVIMRAMRVGFGSVMFDGSVFDYEENVRISSEIAKVAHPMGVGLECELGKVGGLSEGEGIVGENIYTDPNQAKEFIERTGADFLAVSIGTTHGEYKEKPRLDFQRLAEIKREVETPLVLHGGTGLTDSDFKTCIEGGICKVNIYTGIINAAVGRIREDRENLDYPNLMQAAEDSMYDVTVMNIRMFGSSNRA